MTLLLFEHLSDIIRLIIVIINLNLSALSDVKNKVGSKYATAYVIVATFNKSGYMYVK